MIDDTTYDIFIAYILEVDERFCAGKADGTYADPVDCSAFYECSKGKSNKRFCSNGLKFNAMKGKCDEAGNVNCQDKVRNGNTNKRFAKYSATESIEMRDMSPRSIEEKSEKRQSTIPNKRRYRHHHKGLKSYKHHRHGEWKNMNTKKGMHLHRRKLHLKVTGTKIHQGSKRTSDNKSNVKVKVLFTGPNLSGTFETKDPTNPKEGKLTVTAVENAEQGDDAFITRKTKQSPKIELKGGKEEKNRHGDVSVFLQDHNAPMSFSAGIPNGNPFKFGDDLQFGPSSAVGKFSDEKQNKMAGTVVVQASQMGDGTVQTSTTVQPHLNYKGNANEQANDASNGGLINRAVNIKTLLTNSFQTKPQVIYLQKEADSKNENSQKLNGGFPLPNVRENSTKTIAREKTNITKIQGTSPQAVQGIMEALNLIKSIKLNTNSNGSDPGHHTNKSIEQKQKDNTTMTVINNAEKPKEAVKTNKLNVQNGGPTLTNNGNKSIESHQEMNKTMTQEPKGFPKLNKPDSNFGILFIVNKTKNDNKKQQRVNPIIGNAVSIIPDIDGKMKQITDKTSEKTGNITRVNQKATSDDKKQDRKPESSNLPTSNACNKGNQLPIAHPLSKAPETTKDENPKQNKEVSSIHHIMGLMGLILNLSRK
jgi:hypothetical protein